MPNQGIEIFSDIDQGSDAWRACRLGIPTASKFKAVRANGKDGGDSITRKEYLYKLAGEIITGEPMIEFSNAAMTRGTEMEPEARSYYAFTTGYDLQRVGFIRNGQKGCSPDSLIGADGMCEFKTAQPDILIGKLLRGTFPPEHKAQCQGGLWVCEREWLDLSIYWPKMPTFTIREFRDESYIAHLSREVDRFNEELAETVERVRRYGEGR